MQNEQLLDVVQGVSSQPSNGAGSPIPPQTGAIELPDVPPPRERPVQALTPTPTSVPDPTPTPEPTPTAAKTKARTSSGKLRLFVIIGVVIALLGITGAVLLLTNKSKTPTSVDSSAYNDIKLPLDGFTLPSSADRTTSLNINGQLNLSNSVVLVPSAAPKNPVRGQAYFDQNTNQLLYYNGQQFVAAGANVVGGAVTNNTTNIFSTTISGGGAPPAVDLQASAPGVQQAGNFNISGTGQAGTLKSPILASDSSLTLQSSTNASLVTSASSGVTGSITIKSGDSSTTASGNISIDAGNGIIDGEIVEDKTFESGLDDMQNWFNTTIATTTEQARSGSQSLKMTPSSNFWGIIEQLPGTPVTPGHQYHISVWVRAAVTGRTVGGQIDWQGAGGITTPFTSITDNTTGWTEMSLTAPAPAGATGFIIKLNSSTGIVGEAHYFDDITVTDLSSSSAFSSIDIGTANAKVITIGNMNQIGTTSILGSSGVTLNGGAGNLNMSGGTVNLTGNGASTISTSAGALTITSATSATWGIGAASTAAGGNLTLQAGTGAFGNNDGGDLILQGGNRTGTGLAGSIIARAQTNATDTFLIQNSSSINLFAADTSNLRIIISGNGGNFANLVLTDSHFSSTQTTAPTINTPTSCGTTPAAAVTSGSTDTAGSFTITTGLGGTSSSCDTTITFNHAYGATPKSIIVVGNSDANSVARQIYVSNSSATTFTVRFATSAGGADNTMYSYNYWVVE